MEYSPSALPPDNPLTQQGVRATINALAAGLGALHAAGIIHRDIKPANLLIIDDSLIGDGSATLQRLGLLSRTERIVVGDLGLAMDQERTAAGPTMIGGTPFFRSPEQTRRGRNDRTARRHLRRHRRHLEPAHRRTPGGEAAFESQLATAPPAWRSFFARGLAPEPEPRFATMEEWEAAAMEAIHSDSGRARSDSARWPPAPPARTKASRRINRRTRRSSSDANPWSTNSFARCSPRTLVIGGPSGSGKSSLLRAGLIPAISGGSLPGSQHWPILLFVPGADPLDELAYQLALSHPTPPLEWR